ncbi:MAG: sodium/proline symporter PutP [Thermodesulfatator sp.]|nr:MAG: sodium/proline symporter PutP [Thermodesulfatator sp.]
MNLTITLTFLFYFMAVLVIGVIACLRTRDISDYILGGRRLGSLVAALSAGASDMSGWLLLGLPGLVYSQGLLALWLAGGLLLGTWFNWTIVATRLRVMSFEAGNAITLPEFLERRFQDSSRVLRALSAILILFFFTIYTSSGLVAGGKLFNAVFNIPYHWAVIIGGVSVLSYTFIGGFLAVSWTDAFQALLMLFALLAVPALSWLNIPESACSSQGLLSCLSGFLSPLKNRDGTGYSVITILSLLAWGLGYFGQPHILARFMAIDSPSGIKKARLIGTAWAGLAMAGAVLVGLSGLVYFSGRLGDAEKVFIFLVRELMHPAIAGICLAGILAAIMSTADSQLLVSASALTEDFYRGLMRPEAGQKELVLVGRITVIGVCLLAAWFARDPESLVLDIVAYAWAGFGASFGPVLIFSLFWQRMTCKGALLGIVSGGLSVIVWKGLSGGIFDVYELLPGFLISCVVIVVTSLLDSPPARETLRMFQEFQKT